MAVKFGHEGELSAGHRNTTQSMSFGLESGRLRKSSASYSYDIFDANGKLSWNGERNGFYTKGDLSIGHVEGSVEYDNTSFLPKVSARGEANLAKFKGEMGSSRDKVEHKIADVNVNAFGGSVSAQAGGNTVLPAASAEAHTVGGGASVGFDDFRINGGLGNGPSSSASLDAKNMIPDGALDKLNTDTPGFFSDAYGAVKDPGAAAGSINSPFKVSSSEGDLVQPSASIPGAGGIKGNGNGGVDFKADAGPDSYSTVKNLGEAVTGRSGNEKGTPFETNAGAHRRRALTDDAEKFYKDNAKKLDGHHFTTSKTKNNIADDGCGYVNRLNSAIDQAKAQKQAVDAKMRSEDPGSKDYPKWSKQSDELGSEINKMTGIRDNISDLRDRANNLQGRLQPADTAAGRKTEDITRDARANADRFENAFTGKDSGYSGKMGMGEHLSGPAADVCRSRNELNGRINQLDRRLAENNADIAGITKARQDYLKQNGTDLKSALDAKDSKVADFNRREEGLRKENQGLRGEKAECQKALMETDKNFMPRYGSEPYEKKDRDLKSQKLDNENEKAKADDDIVNYCNSHGITKDSNGNYVTPDGQKDPVLDELQDKKKGLDAEGKDIDNLTAENKQDLAKSGLEGKSELKVSEKDGNAVVTYTRDDYGKHAVDNEDMRGPKDTSDSDKGKEGSDNKNSGNNSSDNSSTDDQGAQGEDKNSGEEDKPAKGEKGAAPEENNSGEENIPSDSEKGTEGNENESSQNEKDAGEDAESDTEKGAEGNENSGESEGPSTDDKGAEEPSDGKEGTEDGANSSDGSDGSDSGDDNTDDDGLEDNKGQMDSADPSETAGTGDDNAPDEEGAVTDYQTDHEPEDNPGDEKNSEDESDGMDGPNEDEESDGEEEGEDESGNEEKGDGESEGEDEGYLGKGEQTGGEDNGYFGESEGEGESEAGGEDDGYFGETDGNGESDGETEGAGQGEGETGVENEPDPPVTKITDPGDDELYGKNKGQGQETEGMPESKPEGMPDSRTGSIQGPDSDNSPAEGTSAGMPDTVESTGPSAGQGAAESESSARMPDTSESAGPSAGESALESESSAQMPDTSESAGASEGSSAPEKEASAGMPDASESAGEAVSSGAEKTADAAQSAGDAAQSAGEAAGTGMGI